jgi:carbon storage regulator CsrA
MQILTIDFEENLYIKKNNEIVKLICFPTQDPYVIKLGIDASKNISIHREEIYETIRNQQQSIVDRDTNT